MARPPSFRRIRPEDFPEEERNIVERIGESINDFTDQVIGIFSKNIDYDNLNRQLITVNLKLDATGKLINAPQVRIGLLNGKVNGIIVVKADNVRNPSIYPTSCPFVTFTFSGGILTIQNVTGLPVSSEFNLTLELL